MGFRTVTINTPGPRGQQGERGPQGIPGPSGSTVLTGATNLVVTGSIFASGSTTNANITASGHISASGTGSFGHIKATTIEGNSPLNIKGLNKLDFDPATIVVALI